MSDAVAEQNRMLRDLVTVLQLERLVRQAENVDEIAFRIVNDTRRAIVYDQAILWQPGLTGGLRPQAVTGVSQVDPDAPQMQQLAAVLDELPASEVIQPVDLSAQEADDGIAKRLRELGYAYALWCPLQNPGKQAMGGLFLSRQQPWTDADRMRLDFLASAYAHALFHVHRHTRSWSFRRGRLLQTIGKRRTLAIAVAALCMMFLIPVRQVAVAPAEVAAIKPFILSPPVDGVIATIDVQPNEAVTTGQLLFTLDDRLIRNRNDVARKALEVSRADFERAVNKAFSDPQSKSELAVLKAVVEQKAAEVTYTDELLQRIQVHAPRDGVVLFSDPNDWLGRPVAVGERIMTLADASATELLIWLPVDEAISLETGAAVAAFLNIDPTSTLEATLRLSSYTAAPSPQDILSYQLRARFVGDVAPRIGLKATAKVYGKRAPVIYALLRRPFSLLRQYSGW